VKGDMTQAFLCPKGVKQGEICSPILFSLLIDELAREVCKNGRHGIQLAPDIIEILILMFADDVVLSSYSVIGLQTQLNTLHETALRLGMDVNLEKSNIIVFRNGGYLAEGERWSYGNNTITTVNMYKYLGIYLSTRLSFSHALSDMAAIAKKGIICIFKVLWSLGEKSPNIFFKLFDVQIQPMITYGAEVWGVLADHTPVEKVHLFALKRFLNVSIKASNTMVYGETGRFPLSVNIHIKCIKYWIKLVGMPTHRIPYKAYKMLVLLHERDKKTWASSVCYILKENGLGDAWDNQGVGDVKAFVAEFRKRLLASNHARWQEKLQGSDRFTTYRSLKQSLATAQYLYDLKHVKARSCLIRIRLGLSPLRTHRLKFRTNVNAVDFMCPFCNTELESEVHFLLVCPAYDALRQYYIPRKYFVNPCMFNAVMLLSTLNKKLLLRVANFVLKAFELRIDMLGLRN
jgi:hypothetical protein